MSRKTFFRAWDTYNEAWADEYLAIAEDGHVIEIKNDGTTEYWKDRFIIEFDTGLKDKNGKEIHIGDIVSEHQGDIIGKIVRNPRGEYRIAWIGIFGGESVLYDHLSLCEVIGNIHENPELI